MSNFVWQARDYVATFDPRQYDKDDNFTDPGPSLGENEPQTQKPMSRKGKKTKGKRFRNDENAKLEKASKKVRKEQKETATPTKKRKAKEIVGIDLGTTHSGSSFRSTRDFADNAIHTIMNWPKSALNLPKMPSVIAYAAENQSWGPEHKSLMHDIIGYEVEAGMKCYTWWKLLLDQKARSTEYDDPRLINAVGKGMLQLPPGKTPVDVATDFLRIFLKIVLAALVNTRTQEAMESTPVEFWVTTPAIWNDEAQHNMKQALEQAGFYRRKIDKVEFITEPEAAAVTALHRAYHQGLPLVHMNMISIVADIGGGTVDVEAMKVTNTGPLTLEIIGVGIGGKSGSTTVDRNFIAWLEQQFGESFTSIAHEKRGPRSSLMEAFEGVKKTFGGDLQNSQRIVFAPLGRQLNLRKQGTKVYDMDEGEIIIPGMVMARFFHDTIEQTCKLIRSKTEDVRAITSRSPSVIILAGGLSLSEYVFKEIQIFCQTELGNRLKLLRPENAWGAISHGAVVYGLDRATLISRVARRHYFLVQEREFREGIDSEQRAVERPFIGKRVRGSLRALLLKGEMLKDDQKKTREGEISIDSIDPEFAKVSWKVICSDADKPPEWDDDPSCYTVGELVIDLKGVFDSWSKQGFSAEEHGAALLHVHISGGHGAGVMFLTAFSNRVEVGTYNHVYSE